jgi:DnaK suppressor protein
MATSLKTKPHASRTSRKRQLDLRTMLKDRQRELLGGLQRSVQEIPRRGRGDGLDETEHAEADIQEHIEVALIEMRGDTLQRIREALVRLDAGEYGFCAECEAEIADKRLQALPFAARCTPCEQVHEQRVARERRPGTLHSFPLIFADQAST